MLALLVAVNSRLQLKNMLQIAVVMQQILAPTLLASMDGQSVHGAWVKSQT
jgi:hypothetical protein